VLTLSLIASFMPDILLVTLGIQVDQILSTFVILQNPLVAGVYLAAPYIFMLGMDWRGKTMQKRKALESLKYSELNRNGPLTISEEKTAAPTPE
jgi:hypothetical protein